MNERNEAHGQLTMAYHDSRKAMLAELEALMIGAEAMLVDERLTDQEKARWRKRIERLTQAHGLLTQDAEGTP